MLTIQEIFDKVVIGLRKQGCKSVDKFGRCMYRGLNETKCAAGQILPDELYRTEMEGHSAAKRSNCTGVDMFSIFSTIVGEENVYFLRALQEIHDKVEVSDWENQFNIIAKTYNLTLPPNI